MEDDPLIGRVLGDRYRLDARLGEGGVGVVYRATHLVLDRPVAVKMLHSEGMARESLRLRFEREAQALSSLSHPNIVSISDFGRQQGVAYLVMELVEGSDLCDRLRPPDDPRKVSTFRPKDALAIVEQVLEAMAYAHGRGVLHRDLKPANLFLQPLPFRADHVKVLDFGMAKFVGDGPLGPNERREPSLTGSGIVVGTPSYLAPEVLSGGKADDRVDIYSTGIILYEMLVGERPFVGETPVDVLKAHLSEPVPLLKERLPRGLGSEPWVAPMQKLVEELLVKDPALRFANAGAALQYVREIRAEIAALIDETGRVETVPPASDSAASTLGRTDSIPLVPSRQVERDVSTQSGDGQALRDAVQTALGPSPARRAATALGYVVLGAAVSYGAVRLSQGTDEPLVDEAVQKSEPAERVKTPSQPAAPTGGASTESDATPRPAARDLLSEPLTDELNALAKIAAEAKRSEAFAPLYEYARRAPDDARVHLMLAHGFARLRWREDAVTRYMRAAQVDPAARGDKQMLSDLIEFAGTKRHEERAGDALVAIYGSEALPPVREAAAVATPSVRERLMRVMERLSVVD